MNVDPIHLDDRHWWELCVLAAHNVRRMREEANRARAECRTASTRYFELRARAEEESVRNFANEVIERRLRNGR